jgi:hypothetical protein
MPVYAQPMATFPVRNAATIKLIPTRLERPIGGPTGLAGEGLAGRLIGASAWASSAAAHRRPPPVSGTYETSGLLVLACFNPQWPNLIFGARFGVRFSNRGYLAGGSNAPHPLPDLDNGTHGTRLVILRGQRVLS